MRAVTTKPRQTPGRRCVMVQTFAATAHSTNSLEKTNSICCMIRWKRTGIEDVELLVGSLPHQQSRSSTRPHTGVRKKAL